MGSVIESFLPNWKHARSLTRDYIEAVPEHRWNWTPNPRYASLDKQFRHMICVQGVYVDGLENGKADFARKHAHYSGPLQRDAILDGLEQIDTRMFAAVDAIASAGEDDFTIDFYGPRTLGSYLNGFLYHEAIHHGQWSYYATLGGFETPQSWKLNWGL
jgi:hypothetical protein